MTRIEKISIAIAVTGVVIGFMAWQFPVKSSQDKPGDNSTVSNINIVNNTNISADNNSVDTAGNSMDTYNESSYSVNKVLNHNTDTYEHDIGNIERILVKVNGSHNNIKLIVDNSAKYNKEYKINGSNQKHVVYVSNKYAVLIKNNGANNEYRIAERLMPNFAIDDLGANTNVDTY